MKFLLWCFFAHNVFMMPSAFAAERLSERFFLLGTISGSGRLSQDSVAMLKDKTERKTYLVKVGQRLRSGDVVIAIEKNRVWLSAQGSRLRVEHEPWGGENDGRAEPAVETPYFGGAESFDNGENYVQDYPVDPGNFPPPPPPPPMPPNYSYPGNNYPPSNSPYANNFSGSNQPGFQAGAENWQNPGPPPLP